MSVVLAFETAAPQSSLALVEGDRLLFELSLYHGRDLSRVLLPAVQNCFQLSGRTLQEVDLVAASIGPGSFTGLRIGVTAAKTLAFALGVPTAPISTLHSLAMSGPPAECLVPVLDARRKEVFAAVFIREGISLRRVQPDSLVRLEELLSFAQAGLAGASLKPTLLLAASSTEGLDQVLEQFQEVVLVYPQARYAAQLGRDALERGDTLDPMELAPAYLRRSYAEEQADARIGVQP